MLLRGRCHCGEQSVELTTEVAPEDLRVRQCTCSFCARHRPRYTSDPNGSVVFCGGSSLVRYRFGHALADFLLCGCCGVFLGAYEPPIARAVVNINVLDEAARFTSESVLLDFDAETAGTRVERHTRNWTPASVARARDTALDER